LRRADRTDLEGANAVGDRSQLRPAQDRRQVDDRPRRGRDDEQWDAPNVADAQDRHAMNLKPFARGRLANRCDVLDHGIGLHPAVERGRGLVAQGATRHRQDRRVPLPARTQQAVPERVHRLVLAMQATAPQSPGDRVLPQSEVEQLLMAEHRFLGLGQFDDRPFPLCAG